LDKLNHITFIEMKNEKKNLSKSEKQKTKKKGGERK
jgi:hypothetical protein